MFPVLFSIGNFSVYAYGVFLALAFAIGVFGLARDARKKNLSEENLIDMSLWIMAAAVIGSRLLYILLELPYYLANPLEVFAVRSGGLSFHGGLAGGIIAGLWYTRRHKMPQGVVADLVAPYLALGYGLVRIGCLLNGCCYGRKTDLPWALPAAYLDSTPRHPTQLYAFFAGLLIFAILLYRKKRIGFNGQLFLEFIIYYSIYRFLIEFLRDGTVFIGFLTLGQAASMIFAVAAFVAIRIWPMGRRTKT
jgi:phosphatidylglycerol:prolipoprotein diacylglycerol transferase